MSDFHARGVKICCSQMDGSSKMSALLDLLREADSAPTKVVEVESQKALQTIQTMKATLSMAVHRNDELASAIKGLMDQRDKLIKHVMKKFRFKLSELRANWIRIVENEEHPDAENRVLANVGKNLFEQFPSFIRPKSRATTILALCLGWDPALFLRNLTTKIRTVQIGDTFAVGCDPVSDTFELMPSTVLTLIKKKPF